MKTFILILAFHLLAFHLMAVPPGHPKPARAAVKIHFTGTIYDGKTFEKRINGNLIFRLIPADSGWDIWVGSPANSEVNFCSTATPPFHGINDIYIEGWHFRNKDNSGPNTPGENSDPFPQKDRNFAFTLNPEDNKRLDKLVDKIMTGEYPASTLTNFDKFPKGKGSLHIKTLELGNLKVGEQAWIDKMTFSVDLELPAQARHRRR